MSTSLVCPSCKSMLANDLFKLQIGKGNLLCENCKSEFLNYDGLIDFVAKKSSEKDFYEKRYSKGSSFEKEDISFEVLEKMWLEPSLPERKIFLNELNLSNIGNKYILLLGNGKSLKELYFLKFGAKIIYSDLSAEAVSEVRNKFSWGKFEDKILFHAIDAFNIPLEDESVDIVYGDGFVHHLNDLDSFFREINRVLKGGGKCLFRDGTYSQIWQKLKFSVLRPFVYFSHKKWGISPEDLRATRRGGYSEEEIERIKSKFDFSDMTFVRFGLFSHIFHRGMGKIFGYRRGIGKINKKVIPILFDIDRFFSKRSNFFYKNTMRLVWGFRKRER